jgi:hypothetical protein
VDVKIDGTQPLVYRLERIYKGVNGPEMILAMRRVTTLILRELRIRAPVDQNFLRGGTVMGVSSQARGIRGIVGVPATYGPFQERGTVPHWPPLAALEGWARRHGTTAYIVCRAIARRGNIALWFARDTVRETKVRVYAMLDEAVRRMVND